MCVTTSKAELADTKILSLPLDSGRHYIAYCNTAKNKSERRNAMILPIPGRTTQSMFHDTTKYNAFMEHIVILANMTIWEGYTPSGGDRGQDSEIFKCGIYDVVISPRFGDIIEHISTMERDRQPDLNDSLIRHFTTRYVGYSFVMCLFENDKTMSAQPIAFEYEPTNADDIYFPTVDGHDGSAPAIGRMTSLDHMLIYEHTGRKTREYAFNSITPPGEVPDFLKDRSYRVVEIDAGVFNYDIRIKRSELAASDFDDGPDLYGT